MGRFVIVTLALLALYPCASAQVVYVSPGESIRNAVSAAGTDGEVVLLPGIHPGPVFLTFPHRVIIRSQNGPAATTIDGESRGPALVVRNMWAPVTITGVSFTGGRGFSDPNQPVALGGAIALFHSHLSLENCRFTANSAHSGGAIYLGQSEAEINNCEFVGNIAQNGGAIWLADQSSSLSLADCLFRGNGPADGATGRGGAIGFVQPTGDGQPSTIDRCRFIANQSGSGGALYISRTLLTVRDSLFLANVATGGGAAWCQSNWMSHFDNCTVAGNRARSQGAAFLVTGSPTITNSIIAFNDIDGSRTPGDQLAGIYEWSGYRITRSCVPPATSLWVLNFPGGNVEADPQFVDIVGTDGVLFSGDEDLSLAPCSPAIDAGDSSLVTSTADLAGAPRIVDAAHHPDTGAPDGLDRTVDMGAFEAGANTPACGDDLIGACCLPRGRCADSVAERTCAALQGAFNGEHSLCDDLALVQADSSPVLPLRLGVAVQDTILFPQSLPIDDLVVHVLVDRASADFLRVTVSHADREVLLMSSGCIGPGGVDVYFWDPSPDELLCDGRADWGGRIQPLEPLAVFQGLDAAGPWTLTVTSEGGYDEGTLLAWAVNVRRARPCSPHCIADHLGNGDADIFDLLAFLDDWFLGSADINDDGATDLLDLLVFIDAWFAGCPA